MAPRIVAVVDDLFFLAKIRETARQLALPLETAPPASLKSSLVSGEAGAVLLDLNHRSGRAVETIADLKKDPLTREIPIVGFLSHVQGELAQAARAAGCDQVLARSAFSQQLPDLLRKFSRCEAAEESPS